MTTTKTYDVARTLQQVCALAEGGADIVRVSVESRESAQALESIVDQAPVPIVADVHFQPSLALASLAAGAACVRLDPGNISQERDVGRIVEAAAARSTPLRIGINAGSLDPEVEGRFGRSVDALVASAEKEIGRLERWGFENFKLSIKSSNVRMTVNATERIADLCDVPLHVGLTESGPPPAGIIKATAAISALLLAGIGDTIRYSLTADPLLEVQCGRCLLAELAMH